MGGRLGRLERAERLVPFKLSNPLVSSPVFVLSDSLEDVVRKRIC
jgi:hypothetical protein